MELLIPSCETRGMDGTYPGLFVLRNMGLKSENTATITSCLKAKWKDKRRTFWINCLLWKRWEALNWNVLADFSELESPAFAGGAHEARLGQKLIGRSFLTHNNFSFETVESGQHQIFQRGFHISHRILFFYWWHTRWLAASTSDRLVLSRFNYIDRAVNILTCHLHSIKNRCNGTLWSFRTRVRQTCAFK